MKLVIGIINSDDANDLLAEITKASFQATKLSTSGGFLKMGNVTVLVGVEDEKVDDVIRIIGEHSQKRTEIVPSTVMYGIGVSTSIPLEVTVGGATIFVLDVDRFEKA